MGSTVETDRVLIERAQAGDSAAFGLVVHAYLDRVYRVAYSFVRNADDASDIAQDTFVRAYRGIQRFEAGRPVFPWLYQIARNLALNRITRVRNREVGLVEETLIARDAGPETQVLADDEAARVRAAVARLPEPHRTVIELNHFHECSYREMAETLGIPVGTVMSRLYHARQRLKRELAGEVP